MQEIELSEYALRVLKPALRGAIGTIKREIKNGISHLYLADSKELFIILRPEGLQLVIVAVAGRKLKQAQQEIFNFAVNNNYSTIRFHTQYPHKIKHGLTGFKPVLVEIRKRFLGKDEFVYIINLKGK